jgi:hypothetical protein
LHFLINLQVLGLKFRPKFWLKDFTQSQHQPIEEALITPTFTDLFNPVGHPAESRFNSVRGLGDPFFLLQEVVEKGHRMLVEIIQIGMGLGIFFCVEFFKAPPD